MAKSKVQFQKGYSLFEFFRDYGTEAQCENALFTWPWTDMDGRVMLFCWIRVFPKSNRR